MLPMMLVSAGISGPTFCCTPNTFSRKWRRRSVTQTHTTEREVRETRTISLTSPLSGGGASAQMQPPRLKRVSSRRVTRATSHTPAQMMMTMAIADQNDAPRCPHCDADAAAIARRRVTDAARAIRYRARMKKRRDAAAGADGGLNHAGKEFAAPP